MSSLLVLLIVAVIALTGATDIYVSRSGDDKQSCSTGGTISKPFFSLGTAASCADAGSTIYMRGGDYSYNRVVSLTKSVTIKSVDGENARILIVGLIAPFFAMNGAAKVVIQNIAVSGFNVNGQNIPCQSFIYNFPGASLGSLSLLNVDFQNWESYDSNVDDSNVISGLYKDLTVSNCSFTTSQSYYNPGTHIRAGATDFMIISGNRFVQAARTAFIQDASDKAATGVVTLSNNQFGAGNSLFIKSGFALYVIQDSAFATDVQGPLCTTKPLVAGSTLLSLINVTFQKSSKVAVYASGGCTTSIVGSTFADSSMGDALLKCYSSAMAVSNSVFVNDISVSLCSSCNFTSSNNNVDNVGGSVGSCPL